MTGRERAVSVPVNYTMSMIIITILLTGLILATSDSLQAQQERTVESEFGVLGNRMAADISAADRLARSTEGTTDDVVEVRTDIPETVAGMSYQIEIESTPLAGGEAHQVEITFVSDRADVTETVRLKTDTPVVDTTITGGAYVIEYVDTDGDGEPDSLEVQHV